MLGMLLLMGECFFLVWREECGTLGGGDSERQWVWAERRKGSMHYVN